MSVFERLGMCAISFVHEFVAKIQNPSVSDLCFEEFNILSMKNFVDGD